MCKLLKNDVKSWANRFRSQTAMLQNINLGKVFTLRRGRGLIRLCCRMLIIWNFDSNFAQHLSLQLIHCISILKALCTETIFASIVKLQLDRGWRLFFHVFPSSWAANRIIWRFELHNNHLISIIACPVTQTIYGMTLQTRASAIVMQMLDICWLLKQNAIESTLFIEASKGNFHCIGVNFHRLACLLSFHYMYFQHIGILTRCGSPFNTNFESIFVLNVRLLITAAISCKRMRNKFHINLPFITFNVSV